MGLLYGRAGRLPAKNGGFRPGQDNVCHEVLRPVSAKALSDMCNCQDAPGSPPLNVPSRDVLCAPKTYHVCRFDKQRQMELDEGDISVQMQSELESICGHCGLDMDGDMDGDGAFDDWTAFAGGSHHACTPQICEAELGCTAYSYECPAREEEFRARLQSSAEEDSGLSAADMIASNMSRFEMHILLLEEGESECAYDTQGRLTSLNISAIGVENKVDALVDAGVLRVATAADQTDMADRADRLLRPSRSGTHLNLNLSLTTTAGCETSTRKDCDMAAMEMNDCNLVVQRNVDVRERMQQECLAIIGGAQILGALILVCTCLHFARVFFTHHLQGKLTTDPVVGGAAHSSLQLQQVSSARP